MTFDDARDAIQDWETFLRAVALAMAEPSVTRRESLVRLVVLKGLFVPPVRQLAAQLGLAATDGRKDLSALRLRKRCLHALGREAEAQALADVTRFSQSEMRTIQRARAEMDSSGKLTRATVEELTRSTSRARKPPRRKRSSERPT